MASQTIQLRPVDTEQPGITGDSMRNVSQQPLTDREMRTVPVPADPWDNHRALAIAKGDFDQAERYRMSSGHDQRFRNCDELYLGYVPQRVWEGTRIPRSSLGVPISMDQVEALLPTIIDSIFPIRDNVSVWPKPGTTSDEAKSVFDLLMSQFDDPDDDTFVSCREPIRRAEKQGLIYGNGILEIYWKYKKIRRVRQIAQWVPVTKMVPDPISQTWRRVQTGETQRKVMEVEYWEERNCPCLQNIDIRDFYVDPNLASPNPQEARFCAVRSLTSVGELQALRSQKDAYGQPLYMIPDDATLTRMADNKTGAYADNLKTSTDLYRMVYSQPNVDFTENPASKRLEVIRYYTKDRCVWLLNREWIAYNRSNPTGFMPFLNAFYVDVPNRFYGLAVTDAIEGEQRLQTGIINARVDELALILHPPFIKKRGASILASSQRMSPGKIVEAEDPAHDWIKVEYPGITNNAYIEVDASDRRAQKRTGVTDLGVLGTSSAGGNSAARTATGVTSLTQASGNRITYQVMNLEFNFIEPMLMMAHRMNQQYLSPQQVMQVLGPEGQFIQIDPLNIKNASVKFVIRGGMKMQARAALLQGLPILMQTLLNPAFMQILAEQQQMVPDMKFLGQQIADAFRMPPDAMFRKMQPQEMQQMLQMRAYPELLKQQTQQQRLQAKTGDVTATNETRLLDTLVKTLGSEHAVHQLLSQLTGMQPPQLPEAGEGGDDATQ